MSASKTLTTDIELFAAALFQRKISVWSKTADDIYVLLDCGGVIEKFSPDSVGIRYPNGKDRCEYYLREECEFRID